MASRYTPGSVLDQFDVGVDERSVVYPLQLRRLREQGEALGFGSVFVGPLVRSGYRADEQKHAADTGVGVVAY